MQQIKYKPRILCLFDYACNTGFATVSKNIVRELKQHFGGNMEMDIVAINYFGENYIEPGKPEDMQVRVCSAKLNDPTKDKDGNPTPDVFGRVTFLKELAQNDYSGIFIIQDLNVVTASKTGGAMTDLLEVIKKEKLNEKRVNFKSIYYFPVDCGLIDLQVKGLEFFDTLVSYTEFGKEVLCKHKPELRKRIKVIPHGNNSKNFFPIDNEAEIIEARKTFFGETKPYELFIISNVNRNQPRKDLPNTIFGFIEAKENWPAGLPKPFLYLHTNPDDTEGWDLRIFLQQTNLVEDVDYKITPKEIQEQGASIEFMNMIYNASDLYLTTTTGEGWGLSITEAMATKTPVIATNYSSIPEITDYGKRAWLLETLYPHCSVVGSMIRVQTDLYEVADKIIEVATAARDNTQEYQSKIDAAYKYVLSLDWQIICKQWARYFHEVFNIPYRN